MSVHSESTSKILFVVDATASMGTYLETTVEAIKQLTYVSQMLPSETTLKFGVLLYRDYSDTAVGVLNWSEYQSADFLVKHWMDDARMEARGGGDTPEASKTAFNKVLEIADKNTLVFHFTDAPPHSKQFPQASYRNNRSEERALGKEKYDWIYIARQLKEHEISVLSFVEGGNGTDEFRVQAFAAILGPVIAVQDSESSLTKIVIRALLARFGAELDSQESEEKVVAKETLLQLENGDVLYTDNGTHELSPMVRIIFQQAKSRKQLGDMEVPRVNAVCSGVEVYNCLPKHHYAQLKLDDARKQYYEDEEYATRVHQTFESLLSSPRLAISLTYNAVFGTLWRAICSGRGTEVAERLGAQMSRIVSEMDGYNKEQLQTWLENSYDMSDRVKELIEEAALVAELKCLQNEELRSKDSTIKVLCVDIPEFLSKRDFAKAVRGAASVEEMGMLMKGLASIETATVTVAHLKSMDQKKLPCVPLEGLGSMNVFKLVGHLFAPGTLLSTRSALFLACLVFKARNPILVDHARELLTARKGTWICIDQVETFSEIYSSNYVRAVQCIRRFGLSEEERTLFDLLSRVYRFRRMLNKQVEVLIPRAAATSEVADYTGKCDRCHLTRSLTVMCEGMVCGPCVSEHETPDQQESMSRMFECRSCKAHYAVVNVAGLRVPPKCYYCRNQKLCPTTTCDGCLNSFVDPAGYFASAAASDEGCHKFCGDCKLRRDSSGDQTLKEFSFKTAAVAKLTLKEFVERYEQLPRLYGLEHSKELLSRTSLFKVREELQSVKVESADSMLKELGGISVKMKTVMNPMEVLNQLKTMLERGPSHEECLLCASDVPVRDMMPACGHCDTRLCRTCVNEWYGACKPGDIVLEANLRCPLCRTAPKYAVLSQANRPMAQIARRVQFSPQYYQAWCRSCREVAEHSSRECSRSIPTLNGEFECQKCVESKNQGATNNESRSKVQSGYWQHCPECDQAIDRIEGCPHMTCICGAHFCWNCLLSFPQDTGEDIIYEHIDTCYEN